MKYAFLTFLINALLTLTLHAQVSGDTIPSYWKMDSVNQVEYKKFENGFSKWFHGTYCKKMKIKISCAGCSAFIFDFVLCADSAGKINVIKQGENKFCGVPLSEKRKTEFIKGFSLFILSPYFRNKIIPFRFSRVLKC